MLFKFINYWKILLYISAYNYKKHRKSSIQDDLNKLYDNRPTVSSIEDDGHSAKYHRTSKEERGKKRIEIKTNTIIRKVVNITMNLLLLIILKTATLLHDLQLTT